MVFQLPNKKEPDTPQDDWTDASSQVWARLRLGKRRVFLWNSIKEFSPLGADQRAVWDALDDVAKRRLQNLKNPRGVAA